MKIGKKKSLIYKKRFSLSELNKGEFEQTNAVDQ
jgi:hypothetical protein